MIHNWWMYPKVSESILRRLALEKSLKQLYWQGFEQMIYSKIHGLPYQNFAHIDMLHMIFKRVQMESKEKSGATMQELSGGRL